VGISDRTGSRNSNIVRGISDRTDNRDSNILRDTSGRTDNRKGNIVGVYLIEQATETIILWR